MGLRKAVETLNNAIQDLTSLHVQTYTGVIATEISQTGFDKVRAAVKKAKTDGKVKLVAEAYYQFDGDSYNFLTSEVEQVPARALDLHKSAVEAGMATRQGLMELVKDIFD
jgi:hypothetical protein